MKRMSQFPQRKRVSPLHPARAFFSRRDKASRWNVSQSSEGMSPFGRAFQNSEGNCGFGNPFNAGPSPAYDEERGAEGRVRAKPLALFFLFQLVFFLLFFTCCARAQTVLPTPTATPQTTPLATPTAQATPRALGTPLVTPSPATLPSVVPAPPTRVTPDTFQDVTGLADPNRVVAPPPLLAPTPTPAPRPTSAPVPVVTPAPDAGDVSGNEEPGANFSLEAPDGVIYDMERGLALAQGQVTFRYRELTVKGDRGVIDYNTNRAILSGNLTVNARSNGQSQTFKGRSLVFNLETGQWTLSQLNAEFPPDLFPPGTVLAPLFLTNGTVQGQGESARGEDFRFSSCDRDHYYLRSNRLDFYRLPNGDPERIVLRKNALFVFGRRILPLPVYVISLLGQRSRRQPLQTTAGQNAVDGYFVRSVYDLRANSKLSDSLLADVLSKRGLGLGFQRELVGGGLLYLYGVSGGAGGREINSRLDKSYRLNKILSSNLRFSSTQNNSQSGLGIASQTGTATLVREGERAHTNAVFNFDASSFSDSSSGGGGGSTSRTQGFSLDHEQNFGRGFNLTLNGLFNQSRFGNGAATDVAASSSRNETGDLNVQVGKTGRVFDAFLRTELHQDFANRHGAYQLERLPEFLLQSSTRRFGVPLLSSVLPGEFTLGFGTFNEPSFDTANTSRGGQKSRADFFYNASERRLSLLGNERNGSALRLAGTFEQALYSDNTARYNYAYNANLNNALGPIQVAVNYAKRRTYGYTPFQFDGSTNGEYVDYTASVGRGPNFRLNLSGGRDIGNNYTRDLLANLQWIPVNGTYVSLGTSYGLQAERNGQFGDITANVRFARNRERLLGGQFAFGLRYAPSGTNAGLRRANVSFDTNLNRKFRFQLLAGYDGISKKLDFQQYRLITDLHCFNLYTTYDGSRREVRFDLSLKAFPFADTRFGRNGFSEGFDAGVGEVR